MREGGPPLERIIVAFASEKAQERIVRLLETGGFTPAGCFFTGADVIRSVHQMGAACVITGYKLRDMTADLLALSLQTAAAVLVVTSPVYLELCGGSNLFKLATPLSRSDFFASLELLQSFKARQILPSDPALKEGNARLIRRAKEILMDVNRMTEAEAHRYLQRRSMNTGLRMEETARLILEVYTR